MWYSSFWSEGPKKTKLENFGLKICPQGPQGVAQGFQEFLNTGAITSLGAAPAGVAQQCTNPSLSILGKKIIFSEMVQEGPDGPKRVPNGQKHLG